MPKNCVISCLKYGPGNWQHMRSFAQRLIAAGWNVKFILSHRFAWMNNLFDDVHYCTTSNRALSILSDTLKFLLAPACGPAKVLDQYPFRTLLFVSWHPLNFFVARTLKKRRPDVRIVAWMHEPYKEQKSAHTGKILAFILIEYLQQAMLPFLDVVVVHSPRAFRAFQKRYPQFQGELRQVPLTIMDECPECDPTEARAFDLTFVGNAAPAKGIDAFYELVDYVCQRNLDLRLQLVTSSRIEKRLARLAAGWEKCLHVISSAQLTDESIRQACRNSVTVFLPYRETTQSGVLPVAFMCGTPVIATDIDGLSEYIRDKGNGIVLPLHFSFEDITHSLEHIKANFSQFSGQARQSFSEIWSDKNWEKYYDWFSAD